MPHDDASTPDVHPLRTQRFEKTCDGAPKSIGEVRRAASVWLGGAGLEESVRQRASLVVSELAANAVEAAPGAPFRVSIRIIGADVEIALTSRGRVDQLPPRPWEAPSASTPEAEDWPSSRPSLGG